MNALTEICSSVRGKLFIATLGLALLCLIGTTISGFLEGEGAGGLAFALLPTAVITNVAVLLSYWQGHSSFKLARSAWLGLGLIVLVVALIFWIKKMRDADIVLSYAMLVLSLPVGFIAVSLLSALHLGGLAAIVVIWLVCVVAGYAQWFLLFPRIVHLLKRGGA